MALNRLVYPEVNPVQMVPVGTPQWVQFDNDWFINQIKNYEDRVQYYQKWPVGSMVNLQFHSSISPIQVQLLRCDGTIITTIAATAKVANIFEQDMTTYEASFVAPDVQGTWFVLLSAGIDAATIRFISEPQIIVRNSIQLSNLLYFNYWNTYNDADVLFKTTGIRFNKYIEARVGRSVPKIEATVWENQPKNLQVIGSVPFKAFKFSLGDSYGVPDYEIIKTNAIFGLTNVLLNGRQYTKDPAEEWQENTVENYPMTGWHTIIRLTKNLRSLVSENNVSPAENFLITYNIETNLFGDLAGDVSSNPVQITQAF